MFRRRLSVLTSTAKTLRIPIHEGRCFHSSTICKAEGGSESCDVLIVGGGPAGLAFANALVSHQSVRESLRVALIEAGDLGRVKEWNLSSTSYSNRVSSLTNASKRFLRVSGAWASVDGERTTRIEEMQVWDGVSDARIVFDANEAGMQADGVEGPHMATMTENLNLQRALLRSLQSIGGVDILDNTKVSAIERESEDNEWPVVHTSDGRQIRTRLLVGADGPNSPVRSFAGIESYGWAYDTRAIVATMSHAPRLDGLQRPNTTAYQRFLPTGPIAFLPLSPTISSLVWSTKPALAAALTSANPRVLAAMINAAFRLPEVSMSYLHNLLLEQPNAITPETIMDEIQFRERSHDIDRYSAYSSRSVNMIGIPPNDSELLPPVVTSIQPGTVASFPLKMTHADTYIGEDYRGSRVALLGDAAHTTHPLAGQGLNMGLGDAQALADCIHESVLVGGDIGSRTALMPYARARYFENHKLLSAVDKLHKLYGNSAAPVVWARSVGLEVVNELDTLKAAIMMSAGSGSQVKSHPQGGGPWDALAGAIESVGSAVGLARSLGNIVQESALTGLRNVLQTSQRR